MRFGLEHHECGTPGCTEAHTLKEVGEVLGVCAGRANQVEHQALRNLRHPYRSKRLKPLLDVVGLTSEAAQP